MKAVEYIQFEIQKIKKKYLDSYDEILRDYDIEKSTKENYNKRQFFELLQNASDAFYMIEDDGTIRTFKDKINVKFSIKGNKLIVQNTGFPFSAIGIVSLLRSSTGTKKVSNAFIGNKGLGFRSVLNWTNDIKIITKEFAVSYNSDNIHSLYNQISSERPLYVNELKKRGSDVLPIAVLVCPQIIDIPGEYNQSVFDTTIELQCNDETLESIQSEFSKMTFKEMLFLNDVESVFIDFPKYKRKIVKVESEEKNGFLQCLIEQSDEDTKIDSTDWIIARKFGNFTKKQKYQLAIAYEVNGRFSRESNVLYSFFPTDIRVNYPLLIHGTFELDDARNTLKKGNKTNEFLIKELASLMCDFAENIAKVNQKANYIPLSLLVASNTDIILDNEYHLSEYVLGKIQNLSVFPTLNYTYMNGNDNPLYLGNKEISFLKQDDFNDVLLPINDKYVMSFVEEQKYIHTEFEIELFIKRINKSIDDYSILDKAKVIKLMFDLYGKNVLSQSKNLPHLLIDSSGLPINPSKIAYHQSEEKSSIPLPDWVNVKYIDATMFKDLCTVFEIPSGNPTRSLSNIIRCFGFDEYDFLSMLKEVLKSLNEDQIRHIEFVNWLFDHYQKPENFPQAVSDLQIPLLNKCMNLKDSKSLYFDDQYDNEVIVPLIKDETLFIASSSVYNISDDQLELFKDFLAGLGVSETLRSNQEYKNFSSSDYELLEYLEYPFEFRGVYGQHVTIQSYAELKTDFIVDWTSTKVNSIVNIKSLLEACKTSDIIKYYKKYKSTFAPTQVQFNLKKNEWQRNYQTSAMLSYPLYLLSTTKWVDINGIKFSPNQFLTMPRFEDTMMPIVKCLSLENLAHIFGIPYIKNEIESFVTDFRIARSFMDFPEKTIYQILSKLPQISNSADISRKLYSDLIQDGPIKPKDNFKFPINGMVYCKDGKYHLSSESYYSPYVVNDFILKRDNILDAPRRGKSEKIQNWLGVKQFENKIELANYVNHAIDEEFHDELSNIKLVVFSYRYKDANQTEKSDFSKFDITLCSSLTAKFDNQEISVENYEFLNSNTQKQKYYLKLPSEIILQDLFRRLEFQNAFASIVSDLLDLQNKTFDNMFARLVSLSKEERIKQVELDFNDTNVISEVTEILQLETEESNRRKDLRNRISEKEEQLDIFKNQQTNQFKQLLYNKLLNSNFEEQAQFYQAFYDFQQFRVSILEDDLERSTKSILEQKYPILKDNMDNINQVNIDDIYQAQLAKFCLNEVYSDYIQDFLVTAKRKSLLLFGNIEYLKTEILRLMQENTNEDETVNSLVNADVVTPYYDYAEANIAPSHLESNTRLSAGNGIDEPGASRNSKKLGAIGEKHVYQFLKDYQRRNNVKWISENSKKDAPEGIGNSEGRAGWGYDITYEEDNILTFVEVKATKTLGGSFSLSRNEYSKAREKGNKYFIYIVLDVLGQPQIRNIGNPFCDYEIQTKFILSKVKVVTDSLIIYYEFTE